MSDYKNNRANFGSRSGMTLIEVMLAAFILGIVVIGASAFVSQSYGMMVQAKERRTAISLAENLLEKITHSADSELPDEAMVYDTPYYLLLDRDTGKWSANESLQLQTVTENDIDYLVFVKGIKSLDNTLGNSFEYIDVNVDVQWRNGSRHLNGGISSRCDI